MALHAEAARSHTRGSAPTTRPRPVRWHEPAQPLDARDAGSLAALVTDQIIPRLVLAHAPPPVAAAPAPVRDCFDVAAFTPLTLGGDPRALLAHIERLLADGIAVDTVMVDLLAPAARMLGQWWEEDRCDFVEVTMGLWRLQEVVRELAQRTLPPVRTGGDGNPHRALFAAFPGDQHDFGALMVSELFHRDGWDSVPLIGATMTDLLAEVGQRSYDLIGLTLSCDCHSARLPSAILALRSVSRNPRVRILVGGRVLNEDPALAMRAGADGTAADGPGALILAGRLVRTAADAAAA